jgi:hypothetical protein
MLVARVQPRSEKLSNTWPSYPVDGNNLGKLRLIPDNASPLEGVKPETLRRHRMRLRSIR